MKKSTKSSSTNKTRLKSPTTIEHKPASNRKTLLYSTYRSPRNRKSHDCCNHSILKHPSSKRPAPSYNEQLYIPRASKTASTFLDITSHPSSSNKHITSEKYWRIFCSTSSIRGMQKITKAQTSFLKLLWIGFIVGMGLLLVVTSCLLVIEYLSYYTAWYTSTKLLDPSPFPAMTICLHNPFSRRADDIWKKNTMNTPLNFVKRISNLTISGKDLVMITSVLRNDVKMYYSSLKVNETLSISHHVADLFKFCVVSMENSSLVTGTCDKDFDSLGIIKHISHHEYYNCWSVEINWEPRNTTISAIFVISIVPSYEIPVYQYAFLMDIMERGEGIKFVLHEPGSLPDIDQYGINLQPGKLNDILYEPIQWKILSTPLKKCLDGQPSIMDLGQKFNYSFHACVSAHLQKMLVKKCECLSTLWPRHVIPNLDYPYCSNYFHGSPDEITIRLKCLTKFMNELKFYKSEVQMKICYPRCNKFTYQTTLSISKWIPSFQKLGQINDIYINLAHMINNTNNETARAKLHEYIQNNVKILEKIANNPSKNVHDDLKYNENHFTYVKVTRKTKDTIIKREKLVLDIAILVSRIGGLCSLFIGLSVSFFVEIIEFVYLIWRLNKQKRSRKREASAFTKSRENVITSNSKNNFTIRNRKLKYNSPRDQTEVLYENKNVIYEHINHDLESNETGSVWQNNTRSNMPDVDISNGIDPNNNDYNDDYQLTSPIDYKSDYNSSHCVEPMISHL